MESKALNTDNITNTVITAHISDIVISKITTNTTNAYVGMYVYVYEKEL